ncbi:DUF4192 family protein [Kitasatospora sp. NBC_00240]|uniref:DUF4192 family protein n=1 Tax=Kitasatospora sp. NBC_00240 TaxID=2903567 RepID=UPI002251DC5F|nr:DUF4192 family protein [Kitasatospora sp. NBC_00240]MCX5210509.1 DUF4192 family protein [Kitasatospora sp. NBC_00240]
MNEEHGTPHPDPIPGHLPVRMRGPADMAELLPYLLGFFPDDSIVAVGLQGADLQQGGVIRVDIPEAPADWPRAAAETAALLVRLSERRDHRPAQVLLYLCRDPEEGDARPVLGTLGPLAEALRTAFEARGVSVKESLCVSGGRWWSFLCRRAGCCEPSGNPVHRTRGPGPVVAAATFAGLAPRGSRKAIVAGLAPIGEPGAETQRLAIEQALRQPGADAGAARERSGELLDEVMAEFRAGARELDERRTALLLVGLQDKLLRDRAAEYAEPAELGAAQRLWRFLAKRCVIPFDGYAAAPLTLLAWTSWLADDTATARVVLGLVLRLDPDYLLAQLLHESLNGGLAPEQLLEGVRAERARRAVALPGPAAGNGPAAGERRPPSGRRPVPEPGAGSAAAYEEEPPSPGPDDDRGPGPAPGRSVRAGRPQAPGRPLPGRQLSARTRAAVRRRRRAAEVPPGPGDGLRAWDGPGHRCRARGTAAGS